jgi:thiamine pyrophosphate-dependent acetolactate synthase large subunit-like protein
VVVVVNNNGAYGAERRAEPNPYRSDDSREADLSWKFGQHNFAQIARELGCEGVRIERPTDIGSALQKALGSSGKPVVLDVLTDPTASHPRAWTPPALNQV